MAKKRIYIVYDERAMQDSDEASVYVAGAESLEEARKDAEDFKPCVIYSYAEGRFSKKNGHELTDPKFEEYVSS